MNGGNFRINAKSSIKKQEETVFKYKNLIKMLLTILSSFTDSLGVQ